MTADYFRFGLQRDVDSPTSRRYWLASGLLLLWGLGYALLIAEALYIMRPSDFDRLVNAGMILPGYGDYVQQLPPWIVGLTLFKASSRILGAIGLLLRKRWAVTMYGLSLAVSCLIFFRGFLLDNRGAYEAPGLIGLDVLFFCVSVYALYFAAVARVRGTLR
ncbi:hypothetical protein R0135_05860 [Congregibacter variabilis]|uniref:Uncharacterized protein n=1 Tax=Congregibacter variabilis TaxID=3081200 RepID=A0ABZ0I6A7_9GAMM|nr:hypothetical protein R0135_05860 [Congregibacter sp. IMCC43200]